MSRHRKCNNPYDDRGTEYYPTPERVVDLLVEKVLPQYGAHERILEPCAGTGNIIEKLRDAYPYATLVANEINADFAEPLKEAGADEIRLGNCLHMADLRECTLVVTNPPFSLAFAMLKHLLPMVQEVRGTMILLLRTSWFGPLKRIEWQRKHVPITHLIPGRPKFDGKGSPSSTYAWFAWSYHRSHKPGQLRHPHLHIL